MFGTFHTRLWTRLKSSKAAVGRIRDSIFQVSGKLVVKLQEAIVIVLEELKKMLVALGDICGVEAQPVTELAQTGGEAEASTDLPPYYVSTFLSITNFLCLSLPFIYFV